MCERLRSNHESAAHRDAVSMEESSSASIKSFTDVAMIAGGGRDVNDLPRAAAPLLPHPPNPLLPQGEKGESGHPDAQNGRRNAIAVGLMEIENYSSSHKDWFCRTGLHPLSKADAVCAIPPRASNRLTQRRGGAERGSAVLTRPAGRGCTRCRKQAPRATRQFQIGVNVSENCYNPTPRCGSSRRSSIRRSTDRA